MNRSESETQPCQVDVCPRAGKYLTFRLDKEEFGIRVMKVREIMPVQAITSVPQMPPHIKGVINLRGKVIPVVDLRLKFNLSAAEFSYETCIVVAQVENESGPVTMGVIVDGVSEVVNLTAQEIEDVPDFGNRAASPHILGLAHLKGKLKILLDIERVLGPQDLQNLQDLNALVH